MAGSNQLYRILSEYEAISPAELDRVRAKHQEQGGSLAELLVHESLIDEEDLFFLMSQQLGVPAIPEERLLHLTLSPEIRRRVPGNMAKEWVLVPLDLDTRLGRLSVAMFDPTDLSILDRLQHRARVAEIRAYLARRSAILEVVETAYSGEEGLDGQEEPEDLPWLGSSGDPRKKKEDASRTLDPSPMEPKVELDPDLQQELEAIDGAARNAYSARPQNELEPAPEHLPLEQAELQHGRPEQADLPGPVELGGRFLLQDEPTQRRKLTPEETAQMAEPMDGTDPELEVLPDGDQREDPRHDTARFALTDIDRIERDEFADIPDVDESDETDMEQEITQVVVRSEMIESEAASVSQETPLPEIYQMQDLDALLRELLPSIGVLASMLHERIDPMGGSYREYGRFCRLVARELGMDELTISRVALSAHLFGLDRALRQEVGTDTSLDVAVVFGAQPTAPGGLGPILRSLGAKALNIHDAGEEPLGLRLIRLVADFLELRSESDEGEGSDMETMAQLLRTGGGDPVIVDALVRAIEAAEAPRLRVDGGEPEHDE
jgi:hypothetical protein